MVVSSSTSISTNTSNRAIIIIIIQPRLSDEDVDAERQIIIEEWRKTRNGGMRASESSFRLLTQGSKYAERFPIGLVEVCGQ